MNTHYLDTLPDQENKYGVDLESGEKVVFTVELNMLGTEKGRLLGMNPKPKITLTNHRLIADNGLGIWRADIEEIISIRKAESGKWIFKTVYFAVDLSTEIVFDDGKQKLTGFQFFFQKSDTGKVEEFEALMNMWGNVL